MATVRATELMTANPVVCDADISEVEAERMMADTGVNALVVNDRGKLFGIFCELNKII